MDPLCCCCCYSFLLPQVRLACVCCFSCLLARSHACTTIHLSRACMRSSRYSTTAGNTRPRVLCFLVYARLLSPSRSQAGPNESLFLLLLRWKKANNGRGEQTVPRLVSTKKLELDSSFLVPASFDKKVKKYFLRTILLRRFFRILSCKAH